MIEEECYANSKYDARLPKVVHDNPKRASLNKPAPVQMPVKVNRNTDLREATRYDPLVEKQVRRDLKKLGKLK